MSVPDEAPDGFTALRAGLAAGRRVPMGEKLGFELVEVERGQVVFEATPDRSVYNPLGAVHGGYAATLLDSACGIAVQSALGPNRGHTTLELKVSYLKALTDRSGTVRAAASSRWAAGWRSPKRRCTTAPGDCARRRPRRSWSSTCRRAQWRWRLRHSGTPAGGGARRRASESGLASD